MSIDAELNPYLIPHNDNIITARKLAANAAKLALNNFEWRFVTMVIHNSTIIFGLSAFMQIYRKSIIVAKGTFLHDEYSYRYRITQFVIFGSDLTNVSNILNWMRRRRFDNTGKYIVVCKNCDEREAMNIFWDYKIINVVFIKNCSETHNTIGFTYTIYDNENCEISPPLQVLGSYKAFPMKLTNFHKCQIIASTFIQPPYMTLNTGIPKGADGDLLHLIGEALNVTLKVMTPHRGDGWGILHKDGNWSGSLADIYYDLANFSMTSAAMTLSRLKDFHISTVYHSINMVWVTHPAIPLPAWQKLLRPFQMKVRISLAVTFLIVVLVAVFFKSRLWVSELSKIIKLTRPQTGVIFYSWTICMGMSTSSLPSKPAFLTVFLLWIFYCFMMRTFYQASLIHAMKDNSNYPEFQNLEDILKSGYPLGGVLSLKDYFTDDAEVYDKWVPINSTQIFETMVNLSRGMKYVLAMNKYTARSFMINYCGDLHIVPEGIISSPTALFFKKFSPMTDSLNRVLRRVFEAGFTEEFYKRSASSPLPKRIESRAALNIEHYMGCYVVLATGWIVSVIAFCLEIIYDEICG